MVGIRIVADCVLHSYQVTGKLERDIALEFTTNTAITFIPYWQSIFFYITELKLKMQLGITTNTNSFWMSLFVQD